MPKMNGTGPKAKSSGTGRRLEKCKKDNNEIEKGQLGKGLGKRHKAGGGEGKGKRLQSDKKL